jgi:pimeloyl-ACP methyl ester carboxylesterase
MLLFHGFGQDHHAFDSWIRVNNEYTLYSFDLFFHGQSSWTSQEALEKTDWSGILILFLQRENIIEFEIAGFSMGGKFALATLEAFPEKVRKIILLAPDGVRTSFWYRLATYSIATRALFKSMVLHPHRFYNATKILRNLGLVDKGLLRFAESQMATEEKRNRVYYSWVYFRKLSFSLSSMALLLNEYQIALTMIVGKYDRVIRPNSMEGFLAKVNSKQFEVVEAGHNDLIRKTIEYLSP